MAMEPRTVRISFAAQRSASTGRYEIVPGSKGETRTLYVTSHLQMDASRINIGPIIIIDTKREKEVKDENPLPFMPREVVSIIESYEPLTAFSSLSIWKRNAIYYDEIVQIVGEVSHDCKTLTHILTTYRDCISVWINTEEEIEPRNSIFEFWFRESAFCKVVAYGSYESYEALGRIVFPGRSLPQSTRGEGWRREIFNEKMKSQEGVRRVPVTIYDIMNNVDVHTFADIYASGTHMNEDVFLNLMTIAISTRMPHLHYLVHFYKGMPRSRVQSYIESKLSEVDMKNCVSMWKDLREKGNFIPAVVMEVGKHFCLSLHRFVGWESFFHFSDTFTTRCDEILRIHASGILKCRDKNPEEIVENIRSIVITCFYECARDRADIIISYMVAQIFGKFHDRGEFYSEDGNRYDISKKIIEDGFVTEEHIPTIVRYERNSDIIRVVHETHGHHPLIPVILDLCDKVKDLVNDGKQSESESCYIISHLRQAFHFLHKLSKVSVAPQIYLAISKYMIVYKNHICKHNTLLDSFLETVSEYVTKEEIEETEGVEETEEIEETEE